MKKKSKQIISKSLNSMLLIMICLLLVSCQQTPEQLVNGKDINKMLELAKISHETTNNISERLDIPEKYRTQLTGNLVSVDVNASITVTAIDDIPVIRVKGIPFSQKVTDRLVNALFNGSQLYTFESLKIETQDDIISQLTQYNERKAALELAGMKPLLVHNQGSESVEIIDKENNVDDSSIGTGNELDNVMNMIEILEKKLSQAPNIKELIETTDQLQPFDLSDGVKGLRWKTGSCWKASILDL